MGWVLPKIKGLLLSELNCALFFMIVLSVNHVSQYFLSIYLKPLFLASYLWVLLIYLYHTFITKKYVSGNLFRLSHLFLIVNIICTFLWRENWRFSVAQDFAQLILYMFVCFGAFYHHEGKDDRTILDKVLLVFLIITFTVSLASIIAIHFDSDLISIQENYPDTRPRGFYYETNEGGMNAFVSILAGVYFFRKNRRISGKKIVLSDLLYIMNVPVQILMIKANGSRTSLLVVLLTAIFIILRYLKQGMDTKRQKWVFPVTVCFLGAVCYFLLFTKYGFDRNVYYYINNISSVKELSSEEIMQLLNSMSSYRFYIWKSSFEEIAKHPLLGYGLKSANFTYTVYLNFPNSHNLLINTLLFSGLTGTAVLIVYGIECWLQIRRNSRLSEDLFLKAYVLGYLFISMLEMTVLYNGKAITALFWCVVGYLASPKNEQEADAENSITIVERIRNVVAFVLNLLGITNLMIKKCYSDSQVIRVVNYHRTPDSELGSFEKQLKWYKKRFENVDKLKFEQFMKGEYQFKKPGIILSFDDGLLNNYENAAPLLEKYGFTGWFFVSSGLCDGKEYMTYENMADLVQRGHVLGCHTYTHHRMGEDDTPELLYREITEAQTVLSARIKTKIDIFCWCGGEEDTYTKKASDVIRRSYLWGFMTNNELVRSDTDHYQLQRTNVEARWPLCSAKLQLSGLMDHLYKNKRERVIEKTKE